MELNGELVKQFPVSYPKEACSQEPADDRFSESDIPGLYHPILFLKITFSVISHQGLGLSNDLTPSSFSTNILYAFLVSPIRTTGITHLNLLDLDDI
jgi:hypothetical protein